MPDTLFSLCIPRKSVFDASRRDTVLDLTNLLDGNIDSKEFFAENYLTDGLKQLLRHGLLQPRPGTRTEGDLKNHSG